MAVYVNQTQDSPVYSVEFTPVSDGNFSFFSVGKAEQKDRVKAWLQSAAIGQEILAETVVDGKPVFVTRGNKTQADLIAALKIEGDHFKLHHESKGFTEGAWMLRSALGMTGQGLQLTSSLMRGRRDMPLFVFSVANIAANLVNIIYSSQKSEDINQLHFLKEHVNTHLHQAAPDAALPEIADHRAVLRKPPPEPLSATQKLNKFMEENSVRVGELGLRYLGAFSMASDKNNPYRRITGWGSITGKTLAMASKPEDPYSTKPHTWVDTMREKFTFRTGGAIEAVSFGILSFDAYKHGKIKLKDKYVPTRMRNANHEYRDYLSGTGAALFTLAYVTRHWAKFGEKHVDMEELYAHITDGLAQMPPEKLPQLMAETAAYVKEHFKEQKLDFGKVFTQLMTETYRYHQVALQNADAGKTELASAAEEQSAPSHLERLQRETISAAEAHR